MKRNWPNLRQRSVPLQMNAFRVPHCTRGSSSSGNHASSKNSRGHLDRIDLTARKDHRGSRGSRGRKDLGNSKARAEACRSCS